MKLTSRFVVPVDGPVIENGAIAIRDDRIAAVGPARSVDGRPVVDYGDAVICPGFVNAHTHLELSLLAGRLPPAPDFIGWLRRLVETLLETPPSREEMVTAMAAGLAQSVASGVTMVGDITRRPDWTRPVLAASGVAGVSFGEVISLGLDDAQLRRRIDAASAGEHTSGRLRAGISPHAPYTVEPDAMRACAARAAAAEMPLCMHLGETADEELFTRSGGGPFRDYLRRFGVSEAEFPAAGVDPVELAKATGVLGPQTILAHVNYVSDRDIGIIAASGSSVAYCPRTHAAFGHPPHRFRDMLAAGVNVCLGTDSLASNPSLSILEETRFLRRRHADVDANTLLAMATAHGAKALGLADQAGALSVGRSADIAVLRPPTGERLDRWERMLEWDGGAAQTLVAARAVRKPYPP